MFNVGGGEVIVILLIALIVLGPDKLPGAARQVGKYLNEFRRISSGFQDEIRSAMDVATQTPVDMPPAQPKAEPDPESTTEPAADLTPDPESMTEPITPESTKPEPGPSDPTPT
jgi:Tat protein translocase TatB subunit